jgi:hypothetical protein
MARSETTLKVFLGSPGDLVAERAAVDEVIDEWNATWSEELGIRLQLLRWETDTRPGFGSDSQQVVNDQLGMDYDLFVGLFWARIGTPTPRGESGTVEEFSRALERLRNGEDLEIMMYFKNSPVAPFSIDPAQLQKVHEMRANVQSLGGLFSEFDDDSTFQSLFRVHLSKFVQAWRRRQTGGANEAPKKVSTAKSFVTPGDLDEDLGVLDLMESVQITWKDSRRLATRSQKQRKRLPRASSNEQRRQPSLESEARLGPRRRKGTGHTLRTTSIN